MAKIASGFFGILALFFAFTSGIAYSSDADVAGLYAVCALFLLTISFAAGEAR